MSLTAPEGMQYGRVRGRFITARLDGTDDDLYPDLVPAVGTVTFTPRVTQGVNYDSTPGLTVIPSPIVATLNSQGSFDVFLVATDTGNPEDWTYEVSFAIIGLTLAPFNIAVETGGDVYINDSLPQSVSSGTVTLRGPGGASAVEPISALSFFDAARSGYKLEDFLTTVSGGGISDGDYKAILATWGAANPDLVIVNLLANNALNGGTLPEEVPARMGRLLDDLKALPSSPSVLMMIAHDMSTSAGRAWALYREQMIAVANSKGAGLFDIGQFIPPVGTDSPLLVGDRLHYSNSGHQVIADGLKTFLKTLLTTRPVWARRWIAAQQSFSATILAIGDSLTEGQGATARENRWLDRVVAAYRAEFSLPLGLKNYTAPFYGVYGESAGWANSWKAASANPQQQPYTPEIGRRTLQLAANSDITWSLVGTDAEVLIASYHALQFDVDGQGKSDIPVPFRQGEFRVYRAKMNLGNYGPHDLRIYNPGDEYVYLCGLTATRQQ